MWVVVVFGLRGKQKAVGSVIRLKIETKPTKIRTEFTSFLVMCREDMLWEAMLSETTPLKFRIDKPVEYTVLSEFVFDANEPKTVMVGIKHRIDAVLAMIASMAADSKSQGTESFAMSIPTKAARVFSRMPNPKLSRWPGLVALYIKRAPRDAMLPATSTMDRACGPTPPAIM